MCVHYKKLYDCDHVYHYQTVKCSRNLDNW